LHSSKQIKIAIVIPFYNGDDLIEACVSSILDSTCSVQKIYIIDNSTEATKIKTLFTTEKVVEIIKTKPAIGFGRACNIGINLATLDNNNVAIIMNQDAVFAKDSIALLAKYALSENTFATVPISYLYDFSSVHPLIYSGYIEPVNGLVADRKHGTLKNKYSLSYLQANGSCVAFNLSSIKKLPLFDPIFHMYGEDIDLFHRMIDKYNLNLYLIPIAKIGHLHSHLSETKNQDKIKSYGRFGSQIILLKDNMWIKCIIQTIHAYFLGLKKTKLRLIWLYVVSDFNLVKKLPLILKSRDTQFLNQQIKKYRENDRINS